LWQSYTLLNFVKVC